MKIIATTGMPGSGKGEVLNYLKSKGTPAIVMRDVVEDEMKKKGIEINNRTLREFGTQLREKNGMNIVAKMCVPLINQLKNNKLLLIDGIRSYDEVEFFKKKFTKDFVLIAIHVPPQLRFERLKSRGEKWDMKNLEEFLWRDKVELSWGLGNAIALADYVIDNSGSLEDLHKQIDRIISYLDILQQHR